MIQYWQYPLNKKAMKKTNQSKSPSYVFSFIINTALTVVELSVGIASGSAAILADGIQNFSDSLVIAISFMASKSRDSLHYKTPATIDATILMLISIFIGTLSWYKLNHPVAHANSLMIAIGALSVTVNVIAARALTRKKQTTLARAPIVGLFFSALSGFIVLAAGIAEGFSNAVRFDAYGGIIIAILLFYRSTGLLIRARTL